ncbi:MAG: hypothetical protein IM638_14080 [Bacteroidetes bacterium]|nr:hypothetical protein [Bacteroidota bacterium]
MNVLIRLALTALLMAWAVWPYFESTTSQSALGGVLAIDIGWTVFIVTAFFGMVACYCLTLQKCLSRIKPENRKAGPASVWYMFALPFNFVEDFFIVIHLAHSLEEEKKSNAALRNVNDFGLVSGIGWCVAQLLSFIPNVVGQVAGLAGMVLVVYHWMSIVKINKLLRENLTPQKSH